MIKSRLLIFIVFLAASIKLFAQNNVGIGTNQPNSNALLELFSTDKAFLLPRLNTSEMNLIVVRGAIDKGLMIYNTDFDKFYFYNGTIWIPIDTDNQIISHNWSLTSDTLFLSISNGKYRYNCI